MIALHNTRSIRTSVVTWPVVHHNYVQHHEMQLSSRTVEEHGKPPETDSDTLIAMKTRDYDPSQDYPFYGRHHEDSG
jgi:hypothetical protein